MTTMMQRRHLFQAALSIVILLCSFQYSASSSEPKVCTDNDGICQEQQQQRQDTCGLYLAPSTIPNAGQGIFTTRPIEKGQLIGYGGDVAIAYIDYSYLEEREEEEFYNPFEDYVWEGTYMGMHGEIDEDILSGICPGVDAAVNCNPALINIGKVSGYSMGGGGNLLHRSTSPGAGAITPYYNGTTYATAYIPPNAELFKWYGGHWFDTRVHKIGLIPFPSDYDRANVLVRKWGSLPITSQAKQVLWEKVISKITSNQSPHPFSPTRTMVALTMSYSDAVQAARDGIRSLHQPHAIRTLEELSSMGRCLDHIQPGQLSTIPHAGRGAFATRPLAKGTIVTGSPLIAVPFREFFDYINVTTQKPIGSQVLLNYCFSHNSSTLVLCPYGSGVGYINHSHENPNVKLQWSPHGILSHDNGMKYKSVNAFYWQYRTNLAFDFVATRGIQEGEEILLDYGNEWQEAWDKHVKTWQPMPNSENYMSAHDLNSQAQIKTKLEQEMEPYPSNVELRCHSQVENGGYNGLRNIKTWELDEAGIACNVLYRSQNNQDGQDGYEVELQNLHGGKPIRVNSIPRAAIKFVDKPETTDPYLPNAFRHEIMIPDDMFPDAWRNLEEEER